MSGTAVSGFVYKQKVLKHLTSPNFFMNTRRGTLYQLTPHNAAPLSLNSLIVSQSDFQHADKMLNAMKEKGMSFKKYLGILPEEEANTLIYLSPVDYYKKQISVEATSKPNTVKIFSNRGGYAEVTDDQYYAISAKIHPDILVSLTEIPSGKGKKSAKRAVEKSIAFLDKAIETFKANEELKGTMIFASIEGGAFDEIRKECVKLSLERKIDGIVLHGIEDAITQEERIHQIKVSMEGLGESKDSIYSVYSSVGSPNDILIGVSQGVDFFEIDFPNQMAEKHFALNLNFEEDSSSSVETTSSTLEEQIQLLDKRTVNMLDLSQYDTHKDDLSGFVPKCTCYACTHHTKAYVAHLIKCHELTGSILLTIHNVHQYNLFFQNLQLHARNNTLPKFYETFIKNNYE